MPKDDMQKILDKSDKKMNKKKKKGKKKIWKIILLTLVWGILIVIGLGIGVVYSIFNGAGDLPLDKFEIENFTSIVYDKDGNEYTRLDTTEDRIYVSLNEMSPYLPKAFIAIEDERFETHFGVDIKRTGAATIKWLTTGNSDFGGSTITQQLIKKVTQDEGRSWQRKVREIVRAIQLEKKMSKDQIIELYMNLIFLGEGAYGVETAAHTYFNKTAEELTIAECAMIGGLAQAPSSVNPFSNYEKAKARQELVLSKMYTLGYITQEQYNEAKSQELAVERGTESGNSSNSYFVDAVIEEVIGDLSEKYGVEYVVAQKMLFHNGYSIYTTIDPKIQSDIETVYKDQSYFKTRSGYDPELQSAMVIIDYKKGNVVGLVGGAGEKTTLRGLNRATQAHRQPGSSFKPLSVYGPALENGIVTAATVYDDCLTTFKVGVNTWTPENSPKSYTGLITTRLALRDSKNVIAAKIFNDLGVAASRTFITKLGITTLTGADVYPATLALGGLTKGVTLMEQAGAYATFANDGIYLEPKLYTKVVDRNGEVVLEKVSKVNQVMSKQNAYILTSMLQTGATSGTGYEANMPNMSVAGKTGTSNNSKDRWFCGYTPYYTGVVWVGYDKPKSVSVSGNPASKIWKAVMTKVHDGLENKAFVKPAGIASYEICKDSGMIPTELCKNDPRGSRVTTEYFANGTQPTESCTMHVEVEVCPDSNKLQNPVCRMKTFTHKIICLNKTYDVEPKVLPKDYDYMIPTTYCTVHEAQMDENGNWIYDYPWYNNDENNYNNSGNEDESGDDEEKEPYDYFSKGEVILKNR